MLSEKDYFEYFSTHLNLLYFTGYYTGILDEEMEFEDFLKTGIEVKAVCRDALLEDENLLDEYIGCCTEIPKEQLEVLSGFKKK